MILSRALFSKKLNNLAEAEWASPIFKRYGEFVARHPKLLIVLSIVITLFLSLGTLRLSVKDDLRFMYTPPNSPSFAEFRVHKDFQKAQNLSYAWTAIEVVSPGGNVLTEEVSNLILKANKYVFNNMTVTSFLNGTGERVIFGEDLCPKLPLCPDSNRVVEIFLQAYFDSDDGYSQRNTSRKTEDTPKNDYTYPVASIYGVDVFLASNFYNVQKSRDGNVVKVGLVHLTYFYPIRYDDDRESISQFETSLETYFYNLEMTHSRQIQFNIFSMNKLQKEVAQNTFRTLPYLPVSVVILITYTLWTTITCSNPVTSKPMEGLMGVCTTLLAVISAYGLMFACGIPYNSTVAVVPFLTLALAVDDTYIMLAAWKETSARLNTEKRLGETLSSAGCAITVAMLTDVFAFVVGAFSNTPAIEHFCLFIAAAVAFDYFYQLTFFSGFLALSGRREETGKHCLLFWLSAERAPGWRPRRVAPPHNQIDSSQHSCHSSKHHYFDINFMEHFLKRNYASVLLNANFRIIAMVLYVGYVCITFWGCMKLTVNLTPSKLLLDGCEMDRYIDLMEEYMWPEALITTVYIQRAPDFNSAHERETFMEFVQALESTSYSLGRNSTTLWYRDYVNFLNYLEVDLDEPRVFDKNLPAYLKLHDKQRWKRYLHLSNHSDHTNRSQDQFDHSLKWTLHIDSFFFTSGFRLRGWPVLLDLVQTWRGICKNYSEFQPVVFENNNFYADQIASLAPNVIQDTGIAFFCMIMAGGLFIPDPLILFWVTWSLFSMNLGVIGLLALWGCDLDPTAVTSILLSIGLTVDYTLHVAYHYHKSYTVRMKRISPRNEWVERRKVLEETLSVAGWPLIQGGLSTTLAVVALFFVPSYVIGVFLRTVLLVVLLGLFHALIYLPMLLTCITVDGSRRSRVKRAGG